MAKKDSDSEARADDENPEWTREEIRDARPALDVFAALFGTEATQTLTRGQLAKS